MSSVLEADGGVGDQLREVGANLRDLRLDEVDCSLDGGHGGEGCLRTCGRRLVDDGGTRARVRGQRSGVRLWHEVCRERGVSDRLGRLVSGGTRGEELVVVGGGGRGRGASLHARAVLGRVAADHAPGEAEAVGAPLVAAVVEHPRRVPLRWWWCTSTVAAAAAAAAAAAVVARILRRRVERRAFVTALNGLEVTLVHVHARRLVGGSRSVIGAVLDDPTPVLDHSLNDAIKGGSRAAR
jgi:hypothetical protein